jgi:AraC family cel operon transcriptional repressor
MRELRFDNIRTGKAQAHTARVLYSSTHTMTLHRHDFAEIFWIESGSALVDYPEHSSVHGEGTVAVVLPEDVHGFRTDRGRPFVLTNTAFPYQFLKRIGDTYPEYVSGGPDARRFTLGPDHLRRLAQAFRLLHTSRRNPLAVERFILDVLGEIDLAAGQGPAGTGLPQWLLESTERFLSIPRPSPNPVEELARISGRTREHLYRTVSAAAGFPVSAWLRQRMLAKAADLLVLGDHPVPLCAEEARFANISGFYRSFRQAYGLSPGEYRERERRPVAGAGTADRQPSAGTGMAGRT